MALEDVVEGWIEEYEKTRNGIGSMLHSLVSPMIKLTDPESGLQSHSLEMFETVAELIPGRHTPKRVMLAYLAWRLPELHKGGSSSGLYSRLTPEVVVDELYILFYLCGWLPRIVNGEHVKMTGPDSLKLMSFASAKIKGSEKQERTDSRFYRLVTRVSQRSATARYTEHPPRIISPVWTDLVGHVLQFPLLRLRYRPVESFRIYMEGRYNFDKYVVERLKQYMLGAPIDTVDGVARIGPLKNLELLRIVNIQRGTDSSLEGLVTEVIYNEKRGGKNWTQYIDLAGRDKEVEVFHGVPLNSGIITGKPTEANDYAILKSVVLGKVQVTYGGRKLCIATGDDLYMLLGVQEAFATPEWCAEELIPIFNRARYRYDQHRGSSPKQLLGKVLADEDVVEKLGRITPEQIYCLLIVHQLKEYVRPGVVGRQPFMSNGEKVFILPGENLHLLQPQAKSGDPVLKGFYHRLWDRQDFFDRGYWDVLEEVLAEEAAVNYHGTALKRQDASPLVHKAANVSAA